MRPTRRRPGLRAYTLTQAGPAVWTLRHGRRVRCVWNGPWPTQAILHIAADAVATETGRRVRWRRVTATSDRTLFVPAQPCHGRAGGGRARGPGRRPIPHL